MRTVIYLITIALATVWYGTLVIVAGLLGVPSRRGGVYDTWQRGWSKMVLWGGGVKVSTKGLENVPHDEPVVFISNHQSFFDIMSIVSVLPAGVRFVAKKELLKVPIFGRAMRTAGHVIIDRQNRPAAFEAYEEAAKGIKKGFNAVVFAEGTRSRTGRLQPFKKGPFVLAIAAGVPVIPIYCANTFEILPKGTFRVSPRPVTVYFGTPIPTEGLTYDDREQLLDRAHRVIEQFAVDSGHASG
jgi:1-acyl-sn-glycerol-3-phosphate acyltransferase